MPRTSDIIWLEKTDSTNLELRRRIDTLDNLSVICAVEQTAGRGQGDHTWTSAPGENLTCSVLLRFADISPLRASDALYITKIITLALVDLLSDYGIQARIKWHNDIYVGGLKICGILIENILNGEMISESIVGIGLNVNQTVFPDYLPNPVSIAALKAHVVPSGEHAADVAGAGSGAATGEHAAGGGEKYDVRSIARELREKIARRAHMLTSPAGRDSLTAEFDTLVFLRPQI